jgi:hypothetical protein
LVGPGRRSFTPPYTPVGRGLCQNTDTTVLGWLIIQCENHAREPLEWEAVDHPGEENPDHILDNLWENLPDWVKERD